jgi:hypothetical protein
MEQDIKQQTVVYNKGITNVPSELLSTDGELVSCEGMTFESGELKPIQKAVAASVGSISGELMCVHDDRYIYKDGSWLRYKKDNVTGTVMPYSGTLKDVTTVGNTVIAATSEEVHYALWTGSNYTDLGNKIPEPDVRFKLVRGGTVAVYDDIPYSTLDPIGAMASSGFRIKDQPSLNDFIYGMYANLKRKAAQEKGFLFPFSVRYAVELYDGTMVMHSAPILMFPSISKNFLARYSVVADTMEDAYKWTLSMQYSWLSYMNTTDYTDYKDIVKGVVVFVSEGVDIYETGADCICEVIQSGEQLIDYVRSETTSGRQVYGNITVEDSDYINTRFLNSKPLNDILTELSENSVFFKLSTLKRQTTGYKVLYDFPTSRLMNLTAQPDLSSQGEDYFSNSELTGEQAYTYNGRLHLSNVTRSIFEGYDHFMGKDLSSGTAFYAIYVKINTEQGTKIAKTIISLAEEEIGNYFFYPDRRAYEAVIVKDGSSSRTLQLQEHPGLNGAFYVESPELTPQFSQTVPSITENMSPEELRGTIVVSEVDNPFAFRAKGYLKAGNGTTVGMAAVTMALSEYQHGKQPLVVFSTDGIWSLTVNSEGYYDAIQAVSREVCNNSKSITQVDMGVYFTSAKGLMYLDTSGVTCVSEQMKGTSFEDFIDTCSIAYDYRDSLLHIFVKDSEYHYVYNMKSGTFSTMADTDLYYKAVNNYPDTLIQTGNDNILSLLSKPDEKDDQNVYEGTLVTRAIKFGNLLTLKSIRQMKHLYRVKAWKQGSWTGHQNAKFSVALTLKASNDGYQWATVHSLRGKPWRYWRFELALGNMSAADRLAGTVVWTQERRMEKIR